MRHDRHRPGSLTTLGALIGALGALACSEQAVGPRPVPAGLEVVAGGLQGGVVGQPLDSVLTVMVFDKFHNPVPGVLVRFTTGEGQGLVEPRTRTTGPEGEAASGWRLPQVAGRYTAHAVAAGLDSVTFEAVARPGPVAELVLLSSPVQAAEAGAALDSLVTVEARDAYGNAVTGVTVNFVLREGAGTVDPAQASTDSAGRARATWVLGAGTGSHLLTVRADSLPPVRVRAIVAAPPTVTPIYVEPRFSWADPPSEAPGGGAPLGPAPARPPLSALRCWRNALGETPLDPAAGSCAQAAPAF